MDNKILNNGNVKIYYTIKRGKKEALVFLHGEAGSLSAWKEILSFFERGDYTLIAVDLRGHGYSGRPESEEEYYFEKHVEDILSILKQEKISEVILVGHCMGGMIGMMFASTYPLIVKKLILINTGSKLPRMVGIFKPILWMIVKLMEGVKFVKGGKRVDYAKYKNSHELSLPRLYDDLIAMGVSSFAKQCLACFRWNGEEYLKDISCPVLVIGATKDILYPPSTTKRMAEVIPRHSIVFIESNHVSIINVPRKIYDTMMEFLQ